MADAVIVFDNVHKSYRDVKAVDGIGFEVAPSTCFGLLGRNGAGKCTIMRFIYRKAARDPTPRGTISVFGFVLHGRTSITSISTSPGSCPRCSSSPERCFPSTA